MRYGLSGVAAALFIATMTFPATADEPAPSYTAQQVSQFADLLIEAAAVEDERLVELQAAATPEDASEVHERADATLIRLIETSPLTLPVYDEMVVQAQTDIRLSMQIYDALERRGAIAADEPGPADVAGLVADQASRMTRPAQAGEAGF